MPSAALPRWVNDATHEADCAEAPARSINEVGDGIDASVRAGETAPRSNSSSESATENGRGGSSLSSSLSSSRANEGDAQDGHTAAWRDELATRLNHYRARRKPRPPRYPSLRLVFDRPVRTSDSENVAFEPFSQVSKNALALDAFGSSNPDFEDAGPAPAPAMPSASNDSGRHLPRPPHSVTQNVKTTRIIEFPRSSSTAPPRQLEELADPVMDRPRILEVPDVILAPPALGGITIESAQPQPLEKRPGIDVPLQGAPLAHRLLASAVDVLIVVAACAVSGSIFWKITGVRPPKFQLQALAAGAPCLFWAAYQFLLIVYAGSTPGLRLAKLELTGFNGDAVSRGLRRWRVLASYLSVLALGMGYAWVFLDEDGLCWHDRITHTYLAPGQGDS